MFRPGQERVVRAAVEGHDTLALMPTGSGKSLTYQLAAMLRPTPTLVLSPLIALMKDQVDKLPPAVADTATFVNSSLPAEEARARLDDVREGRTRLLYAAPERLRQRGFVHALQGVGVGLLVIDEVHCVSMWGHDFRPDYLFIRRALAELGEPAILGMTATASPATERAIAQALGRELETVRTSVVRLNLRYEVEHVAGEEERLRSLVARLSSLGGGSAIVYARSRRSCEKLARTLRSYGLSAAHYHAGLEAEERTQVQEAFVSGRLATVVATTAFGMGIDKPDVRLVALVNFPDSVESYVQMVGRAGRDGERSDTVLYASRADAQSLQRFARSDIPSRGELRAVYLALREAGGPVEPESLDAVVGEGHDPRVLVGMLEQVGLVSRGFDAGRALNVEVPPPPDDAGERIEELLERYEREALARAERIVALAEARACRHRLVAEHFGETLDGPCGACDVCAPRAADTKAQPEPAPLPDDIGGTIVDAVGGLRWPLGRTSLVAMLRGSVQAPPSARRSPAYGVLAAATAADVRRWVDRLVTAGALEEFTSEDGFQLVRVVTGVDVPSLGRQAAAPDESLVERLRAWRLERSRLDAVPAYVVLHDATLQELAAVRPRSLGELAGVRGFGPAKLERYGEDVLALVSPVTG